MAYKHLNIQRDSAVVHVELNRAPVNALNSELIAELGRAAREIHDDQTVKVVLLSGAGRNFAAGADIKEISSLPPGDPVNEFSSNGHSSFYDIERGRAVWVAAVRGFCLGGGCELAMACHMRIADRTAVFGQPEIKLGICPGFGATQRLPRIIGHSRAAYMLFTGEQIDARTAYDWGLATILAPEGEDAVDAARKVVSRIASFGRHVIEANRELIAYNFEFDAEQGMDRESELFSELSRTEDMREGFAAFLGKREALFKDR